MHQIHSFQGVPRSSSPQNYHSSFTRERNLVLDLTKSQSVHYPFGAEGKSPYPSPPMSEATPPHDRNSPPRQLPQQRQYQNDPRRASMPHSTYEMYGRDPRMALADPYPRSAYYQMSAPATAPLLSAPPQLPTMNMAPSSSRSPFVHQQPPPSANRPIAKRAKSHVSAACTNCKKAHLACDVERPCNRCTSLGKQDSCKDVPHKKRGRPRLKEERAHSFEVNSLSSDAYRGSELLSPRVSPTVNHSSIHYSPFQSNFPSPYGPRDEVPRFVSSPAFQRPPEHLAYPVSRINQSPRDFPGTPGPRAVGIFSPDFDIIHCNDELRLRFDLDPSVPNKKSLFDRAGGQADMDRVRRLSYTVHKEIQAMDRNFKYYAVMDDKHVLRVAKSKHVEEWASNTSNECLRDWSDVIGLKQSDGSTNQTVVFVRLYRIAVERQPIFFVAIELRHQPSRTYESAQGHRDRHAPILSPLPPTPLHRLSLPGPGDLHIPNSPASAPPYTLQTRTLPPPFDSHSPRYPPSLPSPLPHTPMTSQPPHTSMSSQPPHTPMTSQPPHTPMTSQPHPQTPMTSHPPHTPMTSRPPVSETSTPRHFHRDMEQQARPMSAPGREFVLPPMKSVQKRTRSERDDESEGAASGDDRPREKVRKLDVAGMLNSNNS